jgi:hypothetical protein
MKEQIKKYWLLLTGVLLVILDSGFDAINPILIDLSVSPKTVNYIKAGFLIYGLFRLKQSQPISKKTIQNKQ